MVHLHPASCHKGFLASVINLAFNCLSPHPPALSLQPSSASVRTGWEPRRVGVGNDWLGPLIVGVVFQMEECIAGQMNAQNKDE